MMAWTYVTTGHTMFTDAEIKEDAAKYSDYIGEKGENMVPGRNFAKCPYVVNTGANDAYVRIRVMIPHDGDVDERRHHQRYVLLYRHRVPVSSSKEQTGRTGLSLISERLHR